MRIYGLFNGDFIASGKTLAEKKWKLERQMWSLNKIDGVPDEKRLDTLVIKYVLYHLAKNILKIALYPIAMIGIQLASFYGICFNPWDGREIYRIIEGAFARELPKDSERGIWFNFLYRISDYLSICMYPDETWEDNNFFAMMRQVNPGTLRSRLSTLSVTLRQNQEFLLNEGLNVQGALQLLKKVKVDVHYLSVSDKSEIDIDGQLNQSQQLITICDRLNDVQRSIIRLMQVREKVINARINNSGGHCKEYAEKISKMKFCCKISWANFNKELIHRIKAAYDAAAQKIENRETEADWLSKEAITLYENFLENPCML
jgi:hypothetical protein